MPRVTPRRRPLPWDILALVFKEADPSTLAALGGVSYDFLASTTPTLYQTIEFYSNRQLEALFCERKETSTPSRINTLLSLSQSRTLSLHFRATVPPSTTRDADGFVIKLSSSRMVKSKPIPLESIKTTCTHFHAPQTLASLYSYLFPHLNPTRLFVATFPRDRTSQFFVNFAVSRLNTWTRIQVLELKGCLPFSLAVGRADSLGSLPALTLDRRRVLRLHVETLLPSTWHHPSSLLNVLMNLHSACGLDLVQEGSIVLIVCSEEERRETEKGLRRVMKQRWRNLFVIELED